MASLAGEMAGSGKMAKPPISTHPAFPFIVALWFAALLGIGSLVVPVPVIEKLVTVTGISSLVPQTAPPLGFTARALISLVGTVGGGLIGLLIARTVAKTHRPEAPGRFSQTLAGSGVNARKPISAREELGEIGLDGNATRGRRALAIEEESGPSEVFELAPLPGGPAHPPHIGLDALDPNALDPNALDPDPLDLAEDEALDLDDFAVEPLAEPAQPGFQLLHGEADSVAPRDPLTFGRSRQEFHAPAEDDDLADLADLHASFADSSTETADDDLAGTAQEAAADLHFSPPSLTRSAMAEPGAAEQDGDVPEDLPLADLVWSAPSGETRQTFVAPDEESAIFMPQETQPMQDAAFSAHRPDGEPDRQPQWQESALDDLGLVQLAQRLGSSIEKRRATRAALAAAAAHAPLGAAPSPVMPVAPLADDFDMAEAEEAAQAMAAYFNAPRPAAPFAQQAEPEAVEPAFDEPEAVELAAAPRKAAMGERQMFQPVEEEAAPSAEDYFPGLARIDIGEEDDETDEDDLGSLAASFSLPLGSLAAPAPVAAPAMPAPPHVAAKVSFTAPPAAPVPAFTGSSDGEGDDGEDDAETDFGSLLALNNPFQQRGQAFVRIENEPQPEEDAIEPAVVFPGQGAAGSLNRPFAQTAFAQPSAAPQQGDAEENARALREALLNLQRMSGAA